MSEPSPFLSLLREYLQITQPLLNSPSPPHNTFHRIPTQSTPVWCRPRQLCQEKYAVACSEFTHLQSLGIVRPLSSEWASPLHMALKPNSEWQPCGGYCRLNMCSVLDRYPIPHIMEFTSGLSGCFIFSKIDLIYGYHQIPVHHGDIHKTTITTSFGLWEFLQMPFGLRIAVKHFST